MDRRAVLRAGAFLGVLVVFVHGGLLGQERVLATIEGFEVTTPPMGSEGMECSRTPLIALAGLVAGYTDGYKVGLRVGAGLAGVPDNEIESVVRYADTGLTRYAAYAAEAKALCDKYPAADARSVVKVAFHSVVVQTHGGLDR